MKPFILMTFLTFYISCSNSGVDRNQDIANKIDSLQTVDSLNNSIISDFRDKVRIDSAIVAELEYQIKGYEEITKILKNIVNSVDSISYSIGADIGDNLITQGIDINYDAFLGGFKNGYEKKTHLLTTNERKQLFKTMQDRMRTKQQAESKKALEKAETFLKDNKDQNKDILETKSGLQYRVVRKGKGKSPDSASDQVRVNYEGKLVDGTIFDSSYEKGEPFVTRLNRVIKGWTEGIQLMNEGSEYEFFIHPRLAYGPRPNNNIPANSVLIFKVELQKVFEKNIK